MKNRKGPAVDCYICHKPITWRGQVMWRLWQATYLSAEVEQYAHFSCFNRGRWYGSGRRIWVRWEDRPRDDIDITEAELTF